MKVYPLVFDLKLIFSKKKSFFCSVYEYHFSLICVYWLSSTADEIFIPQHKVTVLSLVGFPKGLQERLNGMVWERSVLC